MSGDTSSSPCADRSFRRPNILVIYTDQQRYDTLRCAGSPWAITPNLDRLAAQGAFLENTYVQSPVCAPSRCSFLSGRYCSSTGVGWNGIPFPENDVDPIPKLLKPYGYKTAQIGKLHFTPTILREHRDPHPTYGFDTLILSDQPGSYDDAYIKWVESLAPEQVQAARLPVHPIPQRYGHPTTKPAVEEVVPKLFEADDDLTHSAFVADQTCRFLEDNATGEPFFAIAGFFFPHMPLVAVERFVKMFNPVDMPVPKWNAEEEAAMKQTGAVFASWTKEDWQLARAYYAALVTEVDYYTGRILQKLDDLGLTDNTLVIFTSDHGEFIGDHGRIQKGMPGHDCITRVPMIARYPGVIPEGTRIPALVEHVDVVPTLLDFAGIQKPAAIQGRSLKRLLKGETTEHREDVLTEAFTAQGPMETTVRTARHKYYVHERGREILYDLDRDPDELRNVAEDPAYHSVLHEMRARALSRLQGACNQRRRAAVPW